MKSDCENMSTFGFPMLSGVDGASYAANSGPQKSALLRCRPIIEKAIAMQQESFLEMKKKKKKNGGSHDADNHHEEVFRIADMGCSSGPNCLENMQFLVDTIKKYETETNANRQLQSFFCDLPSNDFNSLFQLQHAHGYHCNYFSAAVAGTVYGRLFPATSLHLVFSSSCLHWLSQTPESISVPSTMEWNKGTIWVDGPHANEAAGRAYAHQWQQDLHVFLSCRKEEMVNDGLMVLLMICRSDSFPPHKMQDDSCFRNLEISWKQLIEEGVLEQCDLDTFNIPMYLPTLEEIRITTMSISNLKIRSLELVEEANGENYWKQWSHDPDNWAMRVDKYYKCIFWNVIEGHVGTTKCEAIFKRFRELLKTTLLKRSSWDSYWADPWSYAIVEILKDT